MSAAKKIAAQKASSSLLLSLLSGYFYPVRGECFTNPVSETYRTMNTLNFLSSSFDTFWLASSPKHFRRRRGYGGQAGLPDVAIQAKSGRTGINDQSYLHQFIYRLSAVAMQAKAETMNSSSPIHIIITHRPR